MTPPPPWQSFLGQCNDQCWFHVLNFSKKLFVFNMAFLCVQRLKDSFLSLYGMFWFCILIHHPGCSLPQIRSEHVTLRIYIYPINSSHTAQYYTSVPKTIINPRWSSHGKYYWTNLLHQLFPNLNFLRHFRMVQPDKICRCLSQHPIYPSYFFKPFPCERINLDKNRDKSRNPLKFQKQSKTLLHNY